GNTPYLIVLRASSENRRYVPTGYIHPEVFKTLVRLTVNVIILFSPLIRVSVFYYFNKNNSLAQEFDNSFSNKTFFFKFIL
ncbi:TPA: hypothetical protein ACGPLL_002235, partial [Streptococcus agalactiae]